MDPQLKNALVAIGLIDINATDAQAMQAWAQYQQQNPAGAQQLMQQAGGSQIPWLTIIGVGAGLVALFLVYQHYKGKTKVDAFEYPEPDEDDGRSERLHEMSQTLGVFKRLSHGRSRVGGCRQPTRRRGLGGKFEPESRLDGIRRKKR